MNNIDLSLYLVTDNSEDEEKFLKTIEEAINGGVSVVQIREKTADTLEFYNLALKVKLSTVLRPIFLFGTFMILVKLKLSYGL